MNGASTDKKRKHDPNEIIKQLQDLKTPNEQIAFLLQQDILPKRFKSSTVLDDEERQKLKTRVLDSVYASCDIQHEMVS